MSLHFLISIIVAVIVSFYSLSFTKYDGTVQSLAAYSGKKVLLINIATGSPKKSQLHELRQLQQRFGDTLVIIGFPSNSYGKEPLSDNAIHQYCVDSFQLNITLAQKGNLIGNSAHPIYQWLADSSANGSLHAPVLNDFHKFLIDEDGKIKAVFSPRISPLDQDLINAIQSTNP
jgi:glutathione peroxidase